MSQRILKCTICGSDHSIFHCENKCGVCHGDKRQCSCSERPPQKKKKKTSAQASSSSSSDAPSYKELQKLYDNLLKEHTRVGQAFQNQQDQQKELATELEDREKDCEAANQDAENLAGICREKEEIVKALQTRLTEAKKIIAELKAEVEILRNNGPQQHQQQQPQQQQPRDSSRVSTHSLAGIHERYEKVLQSLHEHRCSMANAFRLTGCPRSTLRDFVAVAELKVVDSREHDLVIRDLQGGSVKELEVVCRKRLRRYIPVMANMRREGKLLPLKFDDRFYE